MEESLDLFEIVRQGMEIENIDIVNYSPLVLEIGRASCRERV